MNMFTGKCVRDFISLAASGMFNSSLCGCLCSSCYPCEIQCRDVFDSQWLSLTFPTSYVFILPSLLPLLQHPIFSRLWYFLAVWGLSCILLLCCQFSQSVAYATVCICNFITGAPHWQKVQSCMDLCFFRISQEILACAVALVQHVWTLVWRDCFFWANGFFVNISVFVRVQFIIMDESIYCFDYTVYMYFFSCVASRLTFVVERKMPLTWIQKCLFPLRWIAMSLFPKR